ncbi:MAG: hypothetical protein H0W76_27010 [Pyrinomonadaceae bacterium]|nr:hypothetical protein [Pyrinomonadaceae bacterium]
MSPRAHTAILSKDSPRYADWLKVFDSGIVEIISPIPSKGLLPGLGEREIYLVDLKTLSPDQLKRLHQHLAEKFGGMAEEAAEALEREGLPILAEDVGVAVDMRYFT